jgi:hypothetical protein
LATKRFYFLPGLQIRIGMDPRYFEKLNPDPDLE